MEYLIKFLNLFKSTMETPKSFGAFHILWLIFTIGTIIFLYVQKNKYGEKQLKIILAIYALGSLFLEIIKQLIWSYSIDSTGMVIWDYQWYAFPFQLCTTPMIVSLICLFLKEGKLRNVLFSYMSFVTILGSIAVAIIPTDCFVSDIWINIHAMYLHLGSLVVSVYLMMSGNVEIKFDNFKKAIIAFVVIALFANTINILVYNSGILNGETFNMFYISPYFISSLPVFNIIQQSVPYPIYLLLYIFAISLGAGIIFGIAKFIQKKDIFDK